MPLRDGVFINPYTHSDELKCVEVTSTKKRILMAICENEKRSFVRLVGKTARMKIPIAGIFKLRKAIASLTAAVGAHELDETNSETPARKCSDSDTAVISNIVATARFMTKGRRYYFDAYKTNYGSFVRIAEKLRTKSSFLTFPLQGLDLLLEGVDVLLWSYSNMDEESMGEPDASRDENIGTNISTIERGAVTEGPTQGNCTKRADKERRIATSSEKDFHEHHESPRGRGANNSIKPLIEDPVTLSRSALLQLIGSIAMESVECKRR